MPPQIRKPAMRPTTTAPPTATSGAPPANTKPVVRAPTPQVRFPPKPAGGAGAGGGSNTSYDPSYRPTGRIMPPDPMAGIPGGGSSSGAGGAGGPYNSLVGAGGPQDIQSAITSLRGQLGIPTVGGGRGFIGPRVDTPGGSAGGAGSAGNPGKPPWQQLAEMGVEGQGSPAANRMKLAQLIAARRGGAGAGGAGGMGGPGGGMGFPGAPPPDSAGGRGYIGPQADPYAAGGAGQGSPPDGGQDTANRDVFGNPTGGPMNNPLLGLLRQRMGGRQMAY